MQLKPIGTVQSYRKEHTWIGWQDSLAKIHLQKEYAPALVRLTEYSHVIVVFAMDNDAKVSLKVTPQGKPGVPKVGLFASR